MRILVISDIHGNLTALKAVIADAGPVDAVWCLGDLVGYGPDPNECVELVRKLPNLVCLIGNHDAAAINKIDLDGFNPDARYTLEWLQNELTFDNIAYMNSLDDQTVIGQVTLVHGSPRGSIYEYLLDARMATQNFSYFATPFCFVGHTHLPVCFQLEENSFFANLIVPQPNKLFNLTPRAIINPGSVGQPRDRDPRAAYSIFDPEENTWDYRRVSYDISTVQERMRSAGLPVRHIERLIFGW